MKLIMLFSMLGKNNPVNSLCLFPFANILIKLARIVFTSVNNLIKSQI